RLNNALADDMANLLMTSISQGVSGMPATSALGLPGTSAQQAAQAARGVGTTPSAAAQQAPATQTPAATGAAGQPQPATAGKKTTLRFISPHRDGVNVVESGLLEDIHVTPDIRTNSLILAAPGKTIELLLAMIRELDALPAA